MSAAHSDEQAVDLHHARLAVRRHRRLVGIAIAVGAAVGLVLALLTPPPFVGTSLVIFDTPAVSGGDRALVVDVDTHAQIAVSDAVLQGAIDETGVAMTPASLRERVRASTPTDSLLRIAVSHPDASTASSLAGAVAAGHVAFIRLANAPASDEERAQLQERVAELQTQASAVDAELAAARARQSAPDATESTREAEAELVALLTGQRAEVAVELSRLRAQLETALEQSASLAGVDARVVPDAVSASRQSVVLRGLLLALAGAVVGAVVGTLLAIRRSRRDRTIWSLDQLIGVVAAPIVAGIGSRERRDPAGWRRILEGYQPPPRDSWAVRRMLRGLGADGSTGSGITLIALHSDPRAQSLGPVLAATAASLNRPTALLGLGDPGPASSLWAGLAAVRKARSAGPWLHVVSDSADADPGTLVLALAVANPDEGAPDVLASSTATVLCVGPGAVTVDQLSRLALSLDAEGREITAVVVADPDDWEEPPVLVSAVPAATVQNSVTPSSARLDLAGGE